MPDKSARSPRQKRKDTVTPVRITERAAAARLATWMGEIVKELDLGLGQAYVDTAGRDRLSPDIVVLESPRTKNCLVLLEAKLPYFDPYDLDLKAKAMREAVKRDARYFGVTNFRRLVWYGVAQVMQGRAEEEQVLQEFTLSEIECLDDIEDFRQPICEGLSVFLSDLVNLHTGKKTVPKKPVDELLIVRLQEKVRVLGLHYRDVIIGRYKSDRSFAAKLGRWFNEQGWEFTGQAEDFEKAARQTAYLLVNKIVFYSVLQRLRPRKLAPMELPESWTQPDFVGKMLQMYFEKVLDIDYESIYTSDFIDKLAFPDNEEVVTQIRRLTVTLRAYDLSRLGYDVLGHVFERLIPGKERHKLGQYFTNTDVVDFVLGFCLQHEDDRVLDPACGSGTFLVRAYQHKRLMNQMLKHEAILGTLWGVDIAKFPAHLATINLALKDLSVDENYPCILRSDFFNSELLLKRGHEVMNIGRGKLTRTLPEAFDAVVGNPPYIRQEEIGEYNPEGYKDRLISEALHLDTKKIADLSKRAGIHAYFFVHGWKFLKEGGRFGFVVASSWLDVEYGRGLQRFLLQRCRIVAIIDSKVERWFVDADVNTCIVVFERCADEAARDASKVRFVSLKKPLSASFPIAGEAWDAQKARVDAVQSLVRTILAHGEFYENDDLRIYPITQEQLWEQGYDAEKKDYIGSKWGKFLRAPAIYFDILANTGATLLPVKALATVRFGIKTGANEFFYLDPDHARRRGIEPRFLQPIIFSLKEVPGYRVERSRLKKEVIICHTRKNSLKAAGLLRYINHGERQKFHKGPTCANRDPWYSLAHDWPYAPLVFPAKVGERMPVFINDGIYEDKKLYGIIPKREQDVTVLAALLNSTITRLFVEVESRQLTGAQAIADIDVAVVEDIQVPNPLNISEPLAARLTEAFEALCKTRAESVFKEIAPTPERVLLSSVKAERRALDQIVMGEILGLSEAQQLEVYRAVVDSVRSRLEKADSAKERRKTEGGIVVEDFVQAVVRDIGQNTLGRFYEDRVLALKKRALRKLPRDGGKVSVVHELFNWKLHSGKHYVTCPSEEEARYLKVFLEAGMAEVYIPSDSGRLKDMLASLEELKKWHDAKIEENLEHVLSRKTRESLLHAVWSALMEYSVD